MIVKNERPEETNCRLYTRTSTRIIDIQAISTKRKHSPIGNHNMEVTRVYHVIPDNHVLDIGAKSENAVDTRLPLDLVHSVCVQEPGIGLRWNHNRYPTFYPTMPPSLIAKLSELLRNPGFPDRLAEELTSWDDSDHVYLRIEATVCHDPGQDTSDKPLLLVRFTRASVTLTMSKEYSTRNRNTDGGNRGYFRVLQISTGAMPE